MDRTEITQVIVTYKSALKKYAFVAYIELRAILTERTWATCIYRRTERDGVWRGGVVHEAQQARQLLAYHTRQQQHAELEYLRNQMLSVLHQ